MRSPISSLFKKSKVFPTSHLILSKQHSVDLAQEYENVLVVGGAGTGKTRHFLKPNLLQANYSYIVTDCCGDCCNDTSEYLQKAGYEVAVLNLCEPEKSAKYNPIEYIFSRDDAEILAKVIMGNSRKFDDKFMYDMSVNLLTALLLLMKEFKSEMPNGLRDIQPLLSDHKMTTQLFERASQNPASEAYKAYERAGIKALHFYKFVAYTIAEKMAIFCLGKYKNIFCGDDELKLNRTSVKRVLYIITPQTDEIRPIVSAIYTQSMLAISTVSDLFVEAGREFEHKTVMFMDDFANTIDIPNFDSLITKCKKHICRVPILHDITRLQTISPKAWGYIFVQFDTILFMGSTSLATTAYISEIAHIEKTIVETLSRSKCIVIKRTQKGIVDDKYELEKHPQWQQ